MTHKIDIKDNIFSKVIEFGIGYFNLKQYEIIIILIFWGDYIFASLLAIGDLREKSLLSIPKDIV